MFAPAARFSGFTGLIAILTSSGLFDPTALTRMFWYWDEAVSSKNNESRRIEVSIF
jgi:hypothetical protein